MTLDALLALARASVQSAPNPASVTDRLARGIIDMFDVVEPCGWPMPTVDRGLSPPGIAWEALDTLAITPAEARAIAAALLRAADEAEPADG